MLIFWVTQTCPGYWVSEALPHKNSSFVKDICLNPELTKHQKNVFSFSLTTLTKYVHECHLKLMRILPQLSHILFKHFALALALQLNCLFQRHKDCISLYFGSFIR